MTFHCEILCSCKNFSLLSHLLFPQIALCKICTQCIAFFVRCCKNYSLSLQFFLLVQSFAVKFHALANWLHVCSLWASTGVCASQADGRIRVPSGAIPGVQQVAWVYGRRDRCQIACALEGCRRSLGAPRQDHHGRRDLEWSPLGSCQGAWLCFSLNLVKPACLQPLSFCL